MSEMRPANSTTYRQMVGKMGFWSAIAAAVLTVLFALLAILLVPPEWAGIEDYAARFHPRQMASFLPVLLLIPALIVLMVSFHYYVPTHKRPWTLVAVALAGIYGAIIATNYYLQLFVVRLNLLAGDLEGLALLAMPNLHSAFFALEAIGYAFLSLATLALALALGGSRLAGWIRWLFVVNGLLGIYGLVIALFDQPLLVFAGLGLWTLIFPAAMILSAILFRRWATGD